MNTTGRQLVDHWTWAAEKGIMNRNSAGALRAACAQVLSVLENWEDLDVTSIDVEDVIRRFQNLRARDFNPASLHTYARRFRSAVDSFLQYSKNPSGWKPASRPIRVAAENGGMSSKPSKVKTEPEAHVSPPAHEVATTRGLIEYPFPLRNDVVARLMLPRDLSGAEAKRIYGFMVALAVDSQPAN
jgi:hypothetical protein